jgi:prepilin-type N-terminal cleavage/methylation domain-containing protein
MASQSLHPGWKTDRRGRPAGFTLVELLTVIVIIGILVGLTTGVVIGARTRAANAAIATEINHLDIAIRAYADKYGEFPPDFAGTFYGGTVGTAAQNMVLRHLARVFPRYIPGAVRGDTTANDWTKFTNDLLFYTGYNPGSGSYDTSLTLGMQVRYLDPASALVFWLAGPSYFIDQNTDIVNGKKRPYGFSANPLNPFEPPFAASTSSSTSRVASMSSRLPILFDFDETRLQPHATAGTAAVGWTLSYYPRSTARRSVAPLGYAPYVYFRAESGTYAMPSLPAVPKFWPSGSGYNSGAGLSETTLVGTTTTAIACRVRPYFNYDPARHSTATQGQFFNPKHFQIICAGLDGYFGGAGTVDANGSVNLTDSTTSAPPRIPALDNVIGGQHFDNITNFSQGTINDMIK